MDRGYFNHDRPRRHRSDLSREMTRLMVPGPPGATDLGLSALLLQRRQRSVREPGEPAERAVSNMATRAREIASRLPRAIRTLMRRPRLGADHPECG